MARTTSSIGLAGDRMRQLNEVAAHTGRTKSDIVGRAIGKIAADCGSAVWQTIEHDPKSWVPPEFEITLLGEIKTILGNLQGLEVADSIERIIKHGGGALFLDSYGKRLKIVRRPTGVEFDYDGGRFEKIVVLDIAQELAEGIRAAAIEAERLRPKMTLTI